MAAHYQAGAAILSGGAFQGETSGSRFARILRYAQWNTTTASDGVSYGASIGNGGTAMGPAVAFAGTYAKDQLQAVADTEFGDYYTNANGALVFSPRSTRQSTLASAYTFGDGVGELPYTALEYDLDPQYVYNYVQMARATTAGKAAVTAANGAVVEVPVSATSQAPIFSSYDVTSNAQYGPRLNAASGPAGQTQYVQTDAQVADKANYILAKYKDAHLRITKLELEPSSNPTLWPACLGAEIGQRVTVNRRNNGMVLSGDYFVDHVSHQVDAKSRTWTTSLMLSPVAYWQVGVLDNQGYNRAAEDPGSLTTTSSITTASTSLSVTTATGSPTLSTASGDYPLSLTLGTGAGAEVVTATAAPAGSTSPQTITVTRSTVNAQAWPAGTNVSITNPLILTF
jgi:hypothetical protein